MSHGRLSRTAILFAAVAQFSGVTVAQSPLALGRPAGTTAPRVAPPEPILYDPQVDVRNGGVLEESYDYHQEGHAYQSRRPGPYPPKGGWYGYGFPVSTYRWGWFGAERYYPRVGWHSDYNGDCVRFAYRYGY